MGVEKVVEVIALVVAAGRGSRFGAGAPKQYLPLVGQPLLRHALTRLAAHRGIDGVRAVIHPDDAAAYAEAAAGLDLLDPVHGGATRQESVRLGLESLQGEQPAKVLIHDGARPFVDAGLVDRVLAALDGHDGAVPGIPVSDTLKRLADDHCIAETVPRADLWRAQTPQGFRFPAILAAHQADPAGNHSDDSVLAERAGLSLTMVAGSVANEKVTTADDLARAERWLAGATETRTGHGFDVHRFATPGSGPVRLCGVEVPYERGLAGHSDADVGLHAIVDALLGALGAGDIGTHFPPSDAAWKGADSAVFMRHVRDLAAGRGAEVLNVDATVICEAPKLGPHRAAMTARVAELLAVAESRVNIKATTSEGLGFTGRGEGIAAQAIATLRLPGSPG